MKKIVLFLIVLTAGCEVTFNDEGARKVIMSSNAPEAIGPYSQAILVRATQSWQKPQTLYLSGQIPIDPETGKMIDGDITAQTRQVLTNIKAVLEEAEFSLSDVVQSQVFLSDLENYKAMNEVYASFFLENPPARAAVQVARLPLDSLVEIMVTAVKME